MKQEADHKSLSELKKTPGRLVKRRFFEAPVEIVAPRLLGKVLARRTRFGWVTGRIVEVEAYLGPHHETPDRAAHSHRGPTPRNRVMFGPAGHAYVYFIYGQYYCMNITCEREGQAGCILLRALEPLAGLEQMARNRGLDLPTTLSVARNAPEKNGAASQQAWRSLRALTSGPSRLCQALELTRGEHNGLDLLDPASPLQVWDDGMSIRQALVTPRIGIRHAADLPLRFSIPTHPCVSGSKRTPGKCIFLRSVSVSTMKRSSSRSSPRMKLQT